MSVVSFDVECTGFKTHRGARMFSFATCNPLGEVRIARLDGSKRKAWSVPQTTPENARKSMEYLRRLWDDREMELSMHNAQFDVEHSEFKLQRKYRRLKRRKVHDTMAMSHVLNNLHPGHSLANLGWELAEYSRVWDDEVKKYTRGGRMNFQQVPKELMDRYQAADVERGMLLHEFFMPKIDSEGFREIYDMECDLIWTTIDIQRRGIMISREKTEQLMKEMDFMAADARRQFQSIAMDRINPGSSDEVAWLLFSKMGFPSDKLTNGGKRSVDKDVLLTLRTKTKHPIIEELLKYRSYSRGRSLLQGYLDVADSDGIIHPSISRYGARTGRQSIREPALQTVNKSTVRNVPYPIPARRCFRPRPGYVNLHIDYKGIEMRLLINESRDPRMIKIMQQGKDPHEEASIIFYGEEFRKAMRMRKKSEKWAKRYKSMRDNGKNCNFAVPYGAGYQRLGEMLRLPESEGHSRFQEYQSAFTDLCNLSRKISAIVREEGFVKTTFGRRLYVPRDKAYAGTNYLIQGTAAGVLKRAQVRVDDILREETGGECAIILPIHDEIVIEIPEDMLDEFVPVLLKIKEAMCDFPQFDVPMDIDVEICTDDWDHLEDFEF